MIGRISRYVLIGAAAGAAAMMGQVALPVPRSALAQVVQPAPATPGAPVFQDPFLDLNQDAGPHATQKQKDALLKQNYKKMREDAAELVRLAGSLQKSVDHSGANVLSVDVVETADKIEKLAKKIKGTARGY